jgi:CO/xanthine dehydrogenase Mo-binding subunit
VTVVEKPPTDAPLEAEELSVVGKSLPKVDADAKVRGRQRYADDLRVPRMLIGKLLRSTRPHALIRRLDVSGALELPGVQAVLTGEHLPIPYGILPVSQDEHALALEKVRYMGEPVAAVAAIDEETAERALDLIEIEYEDLPAAMSISEALRPDTPLIHGEGEGPNVDRVAALEFGDVDAGLEEADHVREDVFFYEGSTHMPIEEHSVLAAWDGGKLTVTTSTQNPHYVHRTLAKVLDVPTSRIRVIAVPVGGGFGGKCDPFPHELVAAKLAAVTDRPVKITLTREEVFYTHRGRHPVLMEVRSGFTTDGKMTALSFRNMLDGGGFGSYGAATTYDTGALQATTYDVPAYRFEAVRVLTNKPPCGPKRGHGTPQPRYALECHLDKVAEDLGIDPVELRRRNQDRQPPPYHELRPPRVHRHRRGGLRLRREARPAAARPGGRLRRERLHVRRRAAHLLQRHVPVGGADQGRPGRRRDRLLDGRRHRPGLDVGARLPRGRGAGHPPRGRLRRHGGHRPDTDRPR